MNINRSNYEIWFVDWLDKNLSSQDVERLMHFLKENPDLRAEFDELNKFNLDAPDFRFPDKGMMKKSVDDLPESQFEYLCVASVENDLPDNQITELNEIIENSPERRKTFDLIKRTRLIPPVVEYKYKSRLLRKTTSQKIIRLSLTALSAAATIALLFTIFSIIPENLPEKTPTAAQNNQAPSVKVNDTVRNVQKELKPEKVTAPITKQTKLHLADSRKSETATQAPVYSFPAKTDSLRRDTGNQVIRTVKIPSVKNMINGEEQGSSSLVAYNLPVISPHYDDGRSNLNKFIARTFREKILKENKTMDAPLKGYEIAEAGVTGLNKLFGWEMALDERNDKNGDLQSVYFSSRILKFNAPVKKTQPLQ